MKVINSSFLFLLVAGATALGGCCRPACAPSQCSGDVIVDRPVPQVPGPTITRNATVEAEGSGAGPKAGSERLFLRYFDVSDFKAGSGDVLLHGVRTQVMPEVWEGEPHANMEYRNGILIVRAPGRLLRATSDWLSETRAGIKQVRLDLAERAKYARTLSGPKVTHETDRSGVVVQIHSVASLTSGKAEGDTDVLLAGADHAPTTIRTGEGVPMAAILRGIESARKTGAWPGAESAIVRAQGEHNLVVKAAPAFQEAVDRHISGLRDDFGDGLAAPPAPPPAPVRAVPPSKDEADKR